MWADENKHGDRKEDEGVDTLEKASELEEWHNEACVRCDCGVGMGGLMKVMGWHGDGDDVTKS